MADAVSEEARVAVGRVLHPSEPALGAGASRSRAAACPAMGRMNRAPRGRDAGQPARPRALEQPHQHGLGLIVGGVAVRDAARARGPGRAPEAPSSCGTPCRGLEPLPRQARGGPRRVRDDDGTPKRCAEPRHGSRFGLGLGAKPVVDVRRRGGTGAGRGRAH